MIPGENDRKRHLCIKTQMAFLFSGRAYGATVECLEDASLLLSDKCYKVSSTRWSHCQHLPVEAMLKRSCGE